MSKGMSLHIGLNFVNPDAYNGWDGALSGCINDANSMEAIAMAQGFQTSKLIDSQATASQVVSKICEISQQLQSGDLFLLTYSGHGGQLPDQTGSEEDGMDETWVLWDRELLDNELHCLWSRFASGVRIFVSSDSCHSGTVVKMLYKQQTRQKSKTLNIDALKKASEDQLEMNKKFVSGNLKTLIQSKIEPKPKFIPIDVSLRSFETKKEDYKYYGFIAGEKERNQINAQLIFISGCQDNQFSYDGDQNGLFTGKLLQVWANGAFAGSHQSFYNQISALMPSYQTPNFMTLGIPVNGFMAQKPYTIQLAGSGTSGGGGPVIPTQQTQSISAPATWGRNNAAPTFQVSKGVNPYYYVEVAADVALFDYEAHGQERDAQNFYGTWNDPSVNPRLTAPTFQLPVNAWNNLKNNQSLFYRVGTTSSQDPYMWDNHMVAPPEDQLYSSVIEIIGTEAPVTPTPQTQKITASVGRGGVNRQADVRLVQELLNRVPQADGGPAIPLGVDGLIGKNTIRAIEDYQEAIGIDPPDGLISPDGPTFTSLVSRGKPVESKKSRVSQSSKQKVAVDSYI